MGKKKKIENSKKRTKILLTLLGFSILIVGMLIITFILKSRSQAPSQSKASSVPTQMCKDNLLKDDFSGANYADNWKLWTSSQGAENVDQTSGLIKLQMKNVSGATAGQYMGLTNKKELSGDFTIEISSKSVSQQTGKSQGLISFIVGEATQTGINKRVEILRDAGTKKLGWQINPSTSDWNNMTKGFTDVLSTLTDDKEVIFRFVRAGKDVSMYYNLNDKNGYKLLKTAKDFSDKNLSVALQVSTWAPDYPPTDAVFDNLMVCKTIEDLDLIPEPPILSADFDGDGKVTIKDFAILVKYYSKQDLKADLNGDGKVNISDFSIFKEQYVKSNK